MNEKKFKEVFKSEGINLLISLKECGSVENAISFLGKKGVDATKSEVSKLLITINSFNLDKILVDRSANSELASNRLSDSKLDKVNGGADQFLSEIFSSLLYLDEKEIHG